MPIKIATWNLCLGLFHKKDYVRSLLYENEIDVFALQEIELSPDIDTENLKIRGYSLEVENNNKKRRVAIYIRNTVTYKRREDLEKVNLHLIILDIETSPASRIITIYRTFNPQDATTPRENFRKQLSIINEATTSATITLGDFNLDENKRYMNDYPQRNLFLDFDEIIGHHQYTQLVQEVTWERSIEGRMKSSIIDHVYCTDRSNVESMIYKETIYGDHKLIILTVSNVTNKDGFRVKKRNWRKYSELLLVNQLERTHWNNEIDNVQEMWNCFEQSLLAITDQLVPYEDVGFTIKRTAPATLKKKHNRRNYLLRKRKRKALTDEEKEEIQNLRNIIKTFNYEQRKNHVRSKIIPGNNKSLWDAVKIAKDLEPTTLPEKLIENERSYNRNEAPSAFANFFKSKIRKLEEELIVEPGVWNGERIVDAEEIDFMTPDKVAECLKGLKTKNCEGYDRLPLRILKDGASALAKPLSAIFYKIYEKKVIPEQWKISKVTPLLKKGNKHDIKHYRPISNLCSASKVFEKLILKRLEEIATENNIDLTGIEQHGFKKNKSTITAGLTLQSEIARIMDSNKYAAMSSLDLSAAFDLVNLDLLLGRMSSIGIPEDIIQLLEVWLRRRYFYVEANGSNSEIIENNIGTIQGSILGPILYAIFIRPLYDIEKITTFADDNYILSFHEEKKTALEDLRRKLERIIKWLKESGLKVNESKTELCVFHRTENTDGGLLLDNVLINCKGEINVLGITFDSKLQWCSQVSRAIKGANKSLQAVKLIRKYFTTTEIVQLLTSNFYSTLYYGSEIWHIPTLNYQCKRMLLSASANALKLCSLYYDPSISYVDLHLLYKRALPNNYCLYRHCLLLFKVFNSSIPKKDWLDLNFRMINTSRQTHFEISNSSSYKVGNNILSNRLSCISKKITLDMLNLPIETFKIKCKSMFLM